MSEQTNNSEEAQKIVEQGGEALDNILDQELSPDGFDPTSDGEKPEPKGAEKADDPDGTEDPSGDDPEPPKEEEGKEPEGEDDPDGGETHDDKGKKSSKKSKAGKKINKLLSQRNSARREVELEKEKRLEAENRAKKAEEELAKRQNGEDPDDDPADEEELSQDEIIDRKLEEKELERKRQQELADLDAKERDELVQKFNPTKEELSEVDEILKDNPKLSDEAALRIVNPSLFVEEAQLNRPDAEKRGSGVKPRRTLRKEPSAKDMTDAELDAEFERQVESGEINL